MSSDAGVGRPALMGLSAQALTVSASLLPVFFGYGDQLVYVIQVTAPVSVVLNVATLSAVMRLPSLSSERANSFLIAATLLSVSFSILTAAAGIVADLSGASVFVVGVLLGVAGTLPAWALYTLAVAEMVRLGDYAGVVRARVVYAGSLGVSTLLVCIMSPSAVLLLSCSVLSFASAALVGVRRTSCFMRLRSHVANGKWIREALCELKRGAALSASQLISGLSNQAAGLFVGSMGSYSPMFAAAIRVTSGYQTIGAQLLAPKLDIDLMKQPRSRSRLRRTLHRSTLVSLGLGLLAAGSAVAAAYWVSERAAGGMGVDIVLATGVILFAFGAGSLAPIEHYLGLLDKTVFRIGWDLCRGGATLLVFLFAEDAHLLALLLGLLFAVASTTHLVLVYIGTAQSWPVDVGGGDERTA